MTHMWLHKEVYHFDMPEQRIMDVYGKNVRHSLRVYLKLENPKVTDVQFDEHYAGVNVIVEVPKYPEGGHPYFTPEDRKQLLTTYMDYANMSYAELTEWWQSKIVKVVT